ncbi:Type II secretion system protein G [Candidatus Saccharibacteria bacterium RAAC3_TM7_1]|nr:Type II secretion system protein G [Candidatus Saccharibacteria bacterium RAAC3_TM7_1]
MSKDDDYATIISIMNRRGFTIVELLIVIVVIAILAAITIVAYSGIQTRAENAKTVAAVSQWAQAIQMYQADKGTWPANNSCLGSPTTYDSSVYGGRCWPPNTSGWTVNASFLAEMQPYVGSTYPEPSTKAVIDTTNGNEFRGAMYYQYSATDKRIYAHFPGSTTCPTISGLGDAYGGTNYSNGRVCYYRLTGP